MQKRFERLNPGSDIIPLLLSQILDEPYPRINRKRSAETAELDEKPATVDYSSITRTFSTIHYKRITYPHPTQIRAN